MAESSSGANEHAGRVREMFAAIATRYDLLNHLLSGNVDRRWRKIVAEELVARLNSQPARLLDVACGTGDLAMALFETTGAEVVAADFCRPMLEIAARKLPRNVGLVEGDALRLPFADACFDAVTIGFGLRNLANVAAGLAELFRVLKPAGCAVVLEFSKPSNLFLRSGFGFYFHRILPVLGGLVSGSRSAYAYLPSSVDRFPDQGELCRMLETSGFKDVGFRNLTGGIAAIHFGRRPEEF
ncbi:MAG: bifunctional demethylmenaquinone methyltransferase/2-methoxy-6-polyprenyl-1,4-benzoquinol methylase UbiE [Pyrinomonadaceae bacterium]